MAYYSAGLARGTGTAAAGGYGRVTNVGAGGGAGAYTGAVGRTVTAAPAYGGSAGLNAYAGVQSQQRSPAGAAASPVASYGTSLYGNLIGGGGMPPLAGPSAPAFNFSAQGPASASAIPENPYLAASPLAATALSGLPQLAPIQPSPVAPAIPSVPPMPPQEPALAPAGLAGPQPEPPGGYQPGDHVEVWSKSLGNWCPGVVERLEGPMVYVKFRAPEGNYLTKGVPGGHAELRLIKSVNPHPAPAMPEQGQGRMESFPAPSQRSDASHGGMPDLSMRGENGHDMHHHHQHQHHQHQPDHHHYHRNVMIDTEEDIVNPAKGTRRIGGLSGGAMHGRHISDALAPDHATGGEGEVQFRMQKHASSVANDIVHEAMFMAKFVNDREKQDVLDRDWHGPNGQNPLLTLFRTGEPPAVAHAFERLAGEVQQILSHQPSLGRAEAPCKVYGDIHGQFRDLLLMLHNYGFPSERGPMFIFNGDWADRGAHQLEVVCLVFAMKCLYPDRVWLVRGNHEDAVQNSNQGSTGFEAECHRKMGQYGGQVFQAIHHAFNWLPLGCLINNRILCVHGGIGKGNWPLQYLENLPAAVARPIDHEKIPKDEVVYNVLWSDPIADDGESRELMGVHDSPRDNHAHLIVTFGKDVTERFCAMNRLDMIIRSHQALVKGYGYDVMHGGKLCRVFSARDYEGSGNDGCVLFIDAKGDHMVVRPQVLRSLTCPKD